MLLELVHAEGQLGLLLVLGGLGLLGLGRDLLHDVSRLQLKRFHLPLLGLVAVRGAGELAELFVVLESDRTEFVDKNAFQTKMLINHFTFLLS